MKSATTHSSRHHQNTQTLLAILNSDTNPVPSHTLRAEPILGTNLHPQEQRSRQFSPRSSLTLEFPAPQRAGTIQDSPDRFLPKKPLKTVPFARIRGQTSPANLEAVNELCQKARGGGRLRLPGRRRGRIRDWGPRSRTWRPRRRRRPRRRGAPQRRRRGGVSPPFFLFHPFGFCAL